MMEIGSNCGDLGDKYGFQPDNGYDGGTMDSTKDVIDVKAPGAGPAGVFQTARYGDFTYAIPVSPVPPGYTVRLLFAELKFRAAGQRKFNVEINGRAVLSDFDIIAEAGAKDKAVAKDFQHIAPSADGFIHLRFSKGSADDAQINGIEVFPSKR